MAGIGVTSQQSTKRKRSVSGTTQSSPVLKAAKNEKVKNIVPKSNDVLSCIGGRHSSLEQSSGNILFKNLIEEYVLKYKNASKTEKGVIINCIIDKVHDKNGRFLILKKDKWQLQNLDKVYDKIIKCLNNLYKKMIPNTLNTTTVPQAIDVILNDDAGATDNKLFDNLIKAHNISDNIEFVVKNIMKMMRNQGSRFLIKSSQNAYHILTEEEAKDRIKNKLIKYQQVNQQASCTQKNNRVPTAQTLEEKPFNVEEFWNSLDTDESEHSSPSH